MIHTKLKACPDIAGTNDFYASPAENARTFSNVLYLQR
jgi:hypothetical protein